MTSRALETAKRALELAAGADEVEVVVAGGESGLTRFANNTIHQNVAEENLTVTMRVALGARVGVASSNDTTKAGLSRLAEEALSIARNQREDPNFPGLPEASGIAQVEGFSRETARMTPAARGQLAASVVAQAKAAGAVASGAVSNARHVLAVANSRGVHASGVSSEFKTSTVIGKGGGSGWAGGVSWSRHRVHTGKIAETALGKCLRSADPVSVEPGEYTVVLEPQATAELVSFMAYMGFGAQSLDEGRSFLAGRMGERVFDESVSIWDDALDDAGLPMPFDMEGIPKRRVSIIDRGTARGVVYDSYYAARAGVASTGHSLGARFAGGPLPRNLFMAPGESSLDEMIASTERGLLVTRFHYTNIADPANAVLTGLTRDGTFLIENGSLAHPVQNLRYTQNMLEAFSAVEAISEERSLEASVLGAAMVPAVKIGRFRFSGATAL